ncbi:MAG: hypothetical protein IKR86_09300 [Candidatus Methanomethylophilaceae archaeon]|nr:hypothetical protein [Candidatus Methanomethylophilaceae archaeon]
MSEAETVGMVLLALATIAGAFGLIAKPMIQLNATITRLEAVITTLQEKMTEATSAIRSQDARLDRAETTLTEHGLRIERLEEECERRHG